MKHLLFAALLMTFVTASGQRTVKIKEKFSDRNIFLFVIKSTQFQNIGCALRQNESDDSLIKL